VKDEPNMSVEQRWEDTEKGKPKYSEGAEGWGWGGPSATETVQIVQAYNSRQEQYANVL